MHSFSLLSQQGLHGSKGKGGTENFQARNVSEWVLLIRTLRSKCIHA